MTEFSSPSTVRDRLRRADNGRHATVEFGHTESRSGIIVRFDLVDSAGQLETLLTRVVELAAELPRHLQSVTDAGWWAGVACMASLQDGHRATILRGQTRSRTHACCIVARGALLDPYPEWPLFRFGYSARLKDLRGEAACAVPSDAELLRYARDAGVTANAELLRSMFEIGVIGWGGAGADGHRRIVGAVHD